MEEVWHKEIQLKVPKMFFIYRNHWRTEESQ